MSQSIFQVNLAGVLKILSESLYSRKEVFVRELIQNAVDAIKARQNIEKFNPNILIEFYNNADAKALIFSDNGVGLTADEMEEFLSKIGASSKSKENLANQRNDFIGQFGIGLLSCFMVSDEIMVISNSLKSGKDTKWTGNIDGTYKTEPLETVSSTGTKVILKLREDIELEEEGLLSLVNEYGRFVGYPIDVEINGAFNKRFDDDFPWKNKGEMNEALLQFGAEYFNKDFQNFFYLETADKKNKGIAFIVPHEVQHGTLQSHRVYVKNMFITNKSANILPEWAFFIKAIINSESLSPTASREEIYDNSTLHEVQDELGNIIKQYLKELSLKAPLVLEKILNIHGIALKSLALSDEAFLKFIYKWFKFQTNQGDLTLGQIKEKSNRILYISNIDEYRQILPISKANETLIINAGYIYEAELLEAISGFDNENSYQRINAEYFGNILNDLSVADYNILENRIESLQQYLNPFKCLVDVKKFKPESIPALFYMSDKIVADRDITEIKKSSDDLWSFISDSIYQQQENLHSKLFLNYNNPVIQKVLKNVDPELDQMIVETLYVNSMMIGHYPLSPLEFEAMNRNMIIMIEKLSK
ncbi:MAG: HSP90 family protein [Chitinophagaceae bacterium]|nr:HSP90 family protein [Chitinophagaceae bacterium]